MNWRRLGVLVAAGVSLAACKGASTGSGFAPPPPTLNTVALTVDTGPTAATGAINHAYVTVTVCLPGNATACASIDHVLLDTGSVGLRLVRSVLAAKSLTLPVSTDSGGNGVEECMSFGGGQTWGPVAIADVKLAGEVAAKTPLQIMDDTGSGAPPPATCGAGGTLINGVGGFGANGVLGLGVFAEDCGASCASATPAPPVYFGCTAAGVCTAENVAASAQVTNPVTGFAADNNGVIVNLPNLQNANGDTTLQGELVFGIGTQTDNALPATGITILGADATGHFTATYNGASAPLPALIDSGTDSYAFGDPTIPVCNTGAFVGYYCPATAPQPLFAVNVGVGANNGVDTVDFALANPQSFVANAAAIGGLGSGAGSSKFTWGMPFFYGRKIYLGIDQRTVGNTVGPLYAY